jgi:hypothetical protein
LRALLGMHGLQRTPRACGQERPARPSPARERAGNDELCRSQHKTKTPPPPSRLFLDHPAGCCRLARAMQAPRPARRRGAWAARLAAWAARLFFALLQSLRSVRGGVPVNGVSQPGGGSSPAAAAPPDAQDEAVTEELFAKVRGVFSAQCARAAGAAERCCCITAACGHSSRAPLTACAGSSGQCGALCAPPRNAHVKASPLTGGSLHCAQLLEHSQDMFIFGNGNVCEFESASIRRRLGHTLVGCGCAARPERAALARCTHALHAAWAAWAPPRVTRDASRRDAARAQARAVGQRAPRRPRKVGRRRVCSRARRSAAPANNQTWRLLRAAGTAAPTPRICSHLLCAAARG